MYSVLDVARYIIWYCKKQGYSISNLKLQKILYFVQANFLVSANSACFEEEIEAWDFGPVAPEAYHEFKIYGSAEIPEFECRNADNLIVKKDKDLINEMVDQCAKYSASSLVEITHNQDPWNNVYEKYCNNTITNDSIKQFFEKE